MKKIGPFKNISSREVYISTFRRWFTSNAFQSHSNFSRKPSEQRRVFKSDQTKVIANAKIMWSNLVATSSSLKTVCKLVNNMVHRVCLMNTVLTFSDFLYLVWINKKTHFSIIFLNCCGFNQIHFLQAQNFYTCNDYKVDY